MLTRFWVAVLMVALAAPLYAGTPSGTAYTLRLPEQKTRTVAAPRCWGMSFSEAGDTKVLMVDNATATTEEQFWYYDSQALVYCADRRPGSAHRGAALACWMQVTTATVSLGPLYSPALGPTHYNLGAGSGEMSYIDLNGAGQNHKPGPCFVAPHEQLVYSILPTSGFQTASIPTYRTKACANGRPCRVDADCDVDASTCLASRVPTGAYLGLAATSTTVDCTICEAR